MHDLRARYASTLTVDAGDLLGWRPDGRRHDVLLDAIRQIGYDAIGLGDNDFVESAGFLSEAIRMRNLPVVAANIGVTAPGAQTVGPAYRILSKGKFRIGVIGLTSVESFRLMTPARMREITIADPVETLRRLLPQVRKQSDVVVVLSHAGAVRDRELARQFPELDVIVGSHSQTILHTPIQEGRTIIVQAGPNGAYAGELTLEFDGGKRIRAFAGRLIPLEEHIPPDSLLTAMLDAYYSALLDQARQGTLRPADRPPFRGATACLPCHETAYKQWQTTPHAHAFQTLVNENKSGHPECLSCHTTGFGQPSGYRDPTATGHLTDVQCEVCHRVSDDHDRPLRQKPPAPVTPDVCAACHTPTQSPGFRYEDAITRVKH